MVDTVKTQLLLDGPRNVVYLFTNQSDGTGETAVTKVDMANLEGSPEEVRIQKIDALTSGMGVNILWDATADVVAFTVPENSNEEFEFPQPLVNNSGAGKTGNISFTTVGASNGDDYSIVLHLKKVGAGPAVQIPAPGSGDAYLLESGAGMRILLESGDVLIFENSANPFLQDETGTNLTDENGIPLEID